MWSGQWILFVVSCAILLLNADGSISEEASLATNQFSVNLLKTVLHDQTGNVVISPISVYTLLAILQQGAGGNTIQELNNILHAQPEETKAAYHNITAKYQESTPLTTLEFATRAFVMSGYNVKQQFQQVLVDDFQSSTENMNFTNTTASSERINSWISEGTHHRINELFAPGSIPANSLLVLVNTIYFNSYWDNPFYGNVQNRSFSPRSGEEVSVPTLYQEEFYPGGECEYLGAKYIHINFEHSEDFSMLLLLPNERYGLDSLMNRLTAENLTNLFPYGAYKKVELQWPKFRLNTDTELIPLLQKLGVNEIFRDSADLSGISTVALKVTKVVQKAEIAVDEDGVTASAATGIIGQPASAHFVPNAEDMEFIADHPFLFFIVDLKHSVPLFAGRVTNPSV